MTSFEMATQTGQAPSRVDSAVNGIASLPDVLRIARDFKAAVEIFSSDLGFHAVTELLDQIPQLERISREKDEKLKGLDAQLLTADETHRVEQQKALTTYSEKYDEFKEEKASLYGTIEGLRSELQEKETAITGFKNKVETFQQNGRELEAKYKSKIVKLKEKEQENADLKDKLKESRSNTDDCSKNLTESRRRVAKLEDSLARLGSQHEGLGAKFRTTNSELEELRNFLAPLHDVDIGARTAELEALWNSATALVGNFLKEDLPEDMLRKPWNKLRENPVFKHPMPLPQSNSDIAKEMRIAKVLGILARLIDEHIFQPTYLSDDVLLRESLLRQAIIDAKKENFARGILLSMLTEEQDDIAETRTGWVMEDVVSRVGIQEVIPIEAFQRFQVELRDLLTQVQAIWKLVQVSVQKLEPVFTYAQEANIQWQTFPIQIAGGQEDHSVSPFPGGGSDEEPLVIFPRFYLFKDGAQPATAGTVLWKAQLRAAAQEERHAPLTQPPLIRHRSRRDRGMSVAAENVPKGNHFLS